MTRNRIPVPTTLYRLYDADDVLLYVGVTYNPKARFTQHRDTKSWWPQVARTEFQWFPSRSEAEAAERELIEAEAPPHNVLHHPVRGAQLRAANSEQYWRRVDGQRAAAELPNTG